MSKTKRYPVDWPALLKEADFDGQHAKLAFSDTFKEWVIMGGSVSMSVVTCPYGRVGDMTPDGEVELIKVEDTARNTSEWVVTYKEDDA